MPVDQEVKALIEDCKTDFNSRLVLYAQMDRYYQNNSDVVLEQSDLFTNSTNKAETNFIKTFIKKEADFILAYPLTYINQDPNNQLDVIINNNLAHWKKDHDKRLFRKSLLFGRCFELYYTNKNAEFSSRIISPLNGYAYFDEHEELKVFIHFFRKPLDRTNALFMDIYIDNMIYHYKDDVFISEDKHIFNEPPVGVCMVDDFQNDTLFSDIKGLQDCYIQNLSDASYELSQYRNAYLKFLNCDIEETEIPNMKKMGILKIKGGKDTAVDWLTKTIDGQFFLSILKEFRQNIYSIGGHIDHAEEVPSNTSSLSIQARELAMRNKTKSNIAAMSNLLKERVRFLFRYLEVLQNKQYSYKLVDFKFTESLPNDNLMVSQMLSQVPQGLISKRTGRSLFSFIDNVTFEEEQVKKEQEEELSIDLDKEVVDENG